MMKRRHFLEAGLATASAVMLCGHSPYQQWIIYRRKHLLIGCHRGDPRTYDLAKFTVEMLDARLPAARARVARAPYAGRLASLLGTGQMEVAIMDRDEAAAMAKGAGPFEPYGAIALHVLAPINDRLLIAQADLPSHHAWMLTEALVEKDQIAEGDFNGPSELTWHPGSADFLRGHPEPSSGQSQSG